MKKKTASRTLDPKTIAPPDDRTWHNGGDIEIGFYARSLHKAAQKLIATLDVTPNPKTAWDACPVVLLYRQAVELQLKSLVGEGSNFLKSPTDHITLAKTHSLRWLAQIVCQIIKAVKWENQFKREGISSLADFSALVDELEELDPVAVAMRPGNRRPDFSVPQQLQPSNVVRFAKRLDALLDLLAATADGLAAEWDLQRDGILTEADLDAGGDFTPMIQ
jgi:hypothetical protein